MQGHRKWRGASKRQKPEQQRLSAAPGLAQYSVERILPLHAPPRELFLSARQEFRRPMVTGKDKKINASTTMLKVSIRSNLNEFERQLAAADSIGGCDTLI
ncbi:hypothetical protein [Janthinobacterium lividum]|uniref:hypothetical protein n=1 Tax=Janthinobacterium lividum TaxID=29581 RepID=UPI00111309D8|nr:hypothetical protein [Janthinobacterium lividum]MCC7716699.1 hypothetical protein [Janthinobacterium lividum]WQE31768.1 hypothetical protein U0004_29575 [Janthinobacterium lividum]